MNELHFGQRIAHRLDHSVRDLSPDITSRLAQAREQALARQKAEVSAHRLAGLAGMLSGHGHGHGRFHLEPRQWLLALALIFVLAIASYWQGDAEVSALEEVDSAVLADELPPNAYLDHGFEAWLKHTGGE